MLWSWRKQPHAVALERWRRGRKADPTLPERGRIAQLELEKVRLEREIAQTRLIVGDQNNYPLAPDPDGGPDRG